MATEVLTLNLSHRNVGEHEEGVQHLGGSPGPPLRRPAPLRAPVFNRVAVRLSASGQLLGVDPGGSFRKSFALAIANHFCGGAMPYDLTTKVGMNKDRLSPAGRVSSDVSDRLIIWRGTAHAEKCVISAHGVQRLGSRTFDIPVGTKVVFYGPDGASLTDPGMTAISGNKIKPYATAERTCPDYSLSKYQGRHGSEKETYSAIVGEVNYAVDHSDHEYDFVTIRNRVFKTSVNFSDVVATLLGYHPYREIHCSFCRSKWFNSPEHDPMLNK